MKALYFHKQQKNTTFLSEKSCISCLSTFPSERSEIPKYMLSHWLMTEFFFCINQTLTNQSVQFLGVPLFRHWEVYKGQRSMIFFDKKVLFFCFFVGIKSFHYDILVDKLFI